MKQDFVWIESSGGPLLFAARSVLDHWSGSGPIDGASTQTDYERACAVSDELGLIQIGTSQAVVLGDEPDRSTFFSHQSGLMIVRWRWADSEDALVTALHSAEMGRLSFGPSIPFLARREEYVLFDSAVPGSGINESLKVDLQAGTYLIETTLFKPNDRVNALIHRFCK